MTDLRSAAAILSQAVCQAFFLSQYYVCADTPLCCSSTWMELTSHVLQVLQKTWQAFATKTCRLYTRTASVFCLAIDPSIGGPYWVHYPQGTGEWAITFYIIFITLYTMVSSPPPPPPHFGNHHRMCHKSRISSQLSCILCLLTTQGVRKCRCTFLASLFSVMGTTNHFPV